MTDNHMAMLLEQMNQRLGRIEGMFDRIGASHDLFEERVSARVAKLELEAARQEGGKKALAGLLAAAATAGGLIATVLQGFFFK